jgi:RNA polymerase sigma-70 factor (ECF subfamily)
MTNVKNEKPEFSNEKASFVNMLTANYYRIHAFVLSMVPNDTDADDIMQETVTLMWQNFDRFQAGTNFVSWAVTIAKFQVLRYQKQKKRSRMVLSDEVYDLLISENHTIQELSHERFRALRECLEKLPEKEQTFIKLRYMDGATAKIVAQKVGSSIDAVYRHGAKLNDLLLRCVRNSLAGGQI